MTHSTIGARRSRRAAYQALSTTLVAIVTTGMIACGGGKDSATAPTITNVAGTYVLQTIDQATLPQEIVNGTALDNSTRTLYDQFVLTVQSGTLVLDENGQYHTSFDSDLVLDGTSPNRAIEAQGTYTLTGKRIVLLRDNGVDWSEGTLENGRVTMQMTLMSGEPLKAYAFQK